MKAIKQITVAAGHHNSTGDTIYALCEDGTVWARNIFWDDGRIWPVEEMEWKQIPGIQDEKS